MHNALKGAGHQNHQAQPLFGQSNLFNMLLQPGVMAPQPVNNSLSMIGPGVIQQMSGMVAQPQNFMPFLQPNQQQQTQQPIQQQQMRQQQMMQPQYHQMQQPIIYGNQPLMMGHQFAPQMGGGGFGFAGGFGFSQPNGGYGFNNNSQMYGGNQFNLGLPAYGRFW